MHIHVQGVFYVPLLHGFRLGIDNIVCPACRCVYVASATPCHHSLQCMQCDLLCSWAGRTSVLVEDLVVLRQPFLLLALAHP